jgi:hypothetical protein
MEFLLFDVGATLAFLGVYLAIANLRRRRVPIGLGRPAARGRGWPRLSHPR